ncbi:hypothetical protein BJX64DRAFT_286896 [Aspergillus heterothallicus]
MPTYTPPQLVRVRERRPETHQMQRLRPRTNEDFVINIPDPPIYPEREQTLPLNTHEHPSQPPAIPNNYPVQIDFMVNVGNSPSYQREARSQGGPAQPSDYTPDLTPISSRRANDGSVLGETRLMRFRKSRLWHRLKRVLVILVIGGSLAGGLAGMLIKR